MASASETSKHYNQVDAEAFVKELSDLIQEKKLSVGGHPDNKVLNFHQPEDLKKLIDLEITTDGASKDEMLALCEKTIEHSVKTGHRHFFNQFYANVDTYSLGGAFLLEALNTNQHTYEVSPVFILVEKYMIKKINSYVGFKKPDGVFVPGGSIGNMMPINLARYKHDKTMKQKGHFGSQRLVMFASADAHYSTKKGASFMGFGSDSCISVKTDARGRMDPVDLQVKIKAAKDDGHMPFYVCATAGSTVLGSFDPINAIADICEEHNLWLHVDGAWGGGVIVSDKHRHLLDGVHRADSFLWNFHKMMRTNLQCSVFLVNHPTILEECFGLKAGYLFQPDKGYDTSFDIGDKTIQCGRKADAFKVWVQWRARGDAGMAWFVDHAYDNAMYLTESIKKSDGFRLTMPEFECTNICFWYIPPSMRGQPETDEWWQKIHKVSAIIKDRMMTEGTMMIGYQPLPDYGWVNFFRIIISNPELTTADMDFVMEEIDRLGKDL